MQYAHRACVQRWCNEKGDVTCEICHEPYEHGYTAPPRAHPDETTIDISGGWTITGTAFDLRDPRILAVAQNHILEAEYDDYSATNASTAAFCRSAALVLMALLLLRHALTLTDEDDDDTSAVFSRRRQRQEAAALAATEVAFILQSGQGRGVHFTIAPDSPATPQHEPPYP
uniref:RING-CH-type domain-containing protein n=1 Tax=Setaria italica TaxID=4555 RepID=K3ZXG1_SETIT